MNPDRSWLFLNYSLAPVLGAFVFSIGFLYKGVRGFLNGELSFFEVLLGFAITAFTGFVVGLAYSFYRPLLRKLGRHFGDFTTGVITLNLVVLVFYVLSLYLPIETFNPDDPLVFVGLFSIIGGFGAWVVNITKAEIDFRNEILQELMDEEPEEDELISE